MSDDDPLVPMYVVSLIVTLKEVDFAKARRLNREEVLRIRDKTPAVMVPLTAAIKWTEDRGYKDLDPEHVWEQWQEIREDFELPDKPLHVPWWRRIFRRSW